MSEKVLIDCDNTMGISGSEIDDGLAILLLAANEKVEIKGITGVFGNGTIDQVIKATQNLINKTGLHHIPFYSGAKSENDYDTEAAKFLVEEVNKNPGEINILAIGPLTNIAGAQQIDNKFLKKVKRIVIMGGITEPLIFNGKKMDELNLSSDPKAAYKVLHSEGSIVLANADLCLQVFFGEKELRYVKNNINWLLEYIEPWYKKGKEIIGEKGFYMWDLVAAAYLIKPEIFINKYFLSKSNLKNLKKGKLLTDKKVNPDINKKSIINIPREIRDIDYLKRKIFSNWKSFDFS